jgi:hypothetical protein
LPETFGLIDKTSGATSATMSRARAANRPPRDDLTEAREVSFRRVLCSAGPGSEAGDHLVKYERRSLDRRAQKALQKAISRRRAYVAQSARRDAGDLPRAWRTLVRQVEIV